MNDNFKLPSLLDITIGNVEKRIYRLVLQDSFLKVSVFDSFHNIEKDFVMEPTVEAWTKFFQQMDKIHVYNWAEEYISKDMIPNGIFFHVVVKIGVNEIDSFGHNAFPPKGQSFGGNIFTRLCNAVERLMKIEKMDI